MKRVNVFRCAIVALCAFALDSCQVVDMVKSGTTYYYTELMTNDDRLVTGEIGGLRSSNLPSAAAVISIKTDEGKREKIKSEDIKYLTISRKGHPENQQTLLYMDWKIPYTRKGEQKYKVRKNWQVLKDRGDNLMITAMGATYSLSKDGALVVTFSSNEGIRYCMLRPGDDCPVYFGRSIYGDKAMREQMCEFLSDDPALCKKIESKEIDAFDFKTIVEQYNPSNR